MTVKLPRMNKKQFRRARELIRRLCANYDGGNCLLLDDGYMPCLCPQLSSYTLICKYFRNAVLPADMDLYGEVIGWIGAKPCPGCGQPFVPPKRNTIYCKSCAEKRIRRSKREWAVKNRVRRRKSRPEKA